MVPEAASAPAGLVWVVTVDLALMLPLGDC